MPAGHEVYVTVYVQVLDVKAALASGERLGGSQIMGPEEVVPDLTIGLFTDPEGHVVGVTMFP